MGIEIERKFLLADDSWRPGPPGTRYRQGYICSQEGNTLRVRLAGDEAWLTVKGKGEGMSRREFEYPIPLEDAREMLDHLCIGHPIDKVRYRREFAGMTWEIDEFSGANEGLLVAEIELASEGQLFSLPSWIGNEVTGDSRYFNVCLSVTPYSKWE
jgi:CYTH domain-containing protein